jgi:hypothetical protein
MRVYYWWERQKERVHWEDVDVFGRIILICMLDMGWDGMVSPGVICDRVWTSGGLL